MNKKYYCISFRSNGIEIINNFKGWYIEYTNNINGYNLIGDEYSNKQVFETEIEAINSIRELRKNEVPYMKIGY